MCMFARKEKQLNVKKAAQVSVHSADTISTLEGFFQKHSYFSIHGFLAAGPSAELGITVLFLLYGSVLKRGT